MNPGKIVITKNGWKGVVYNSEMAKRKAGDKIPVHAFNPFTQKEEKLLCNPSDLKQIGFTD